MTLQQMRERDAKASSAFYAGETDRHPQGVSGKAELLPYVNDRRMWDTAPHALKFSEWGNAAGSV